MSSHFKPVQLVAKVWVAAIMAAGALLASGCGGGDEALFDVPASVQLSEHRTSTDKVAAVTPGSTPMVSVAALEKLSERRIDRTRYEYVFRVIFRNSGATALGAVTAALTGAGSGTVVVEGRSGLTSLAASTTSASEDTITLIHDRTFPFSADALVWDLTAQAEQIARGMLAAGVRVLSPEENARILSKTDARIVFQGPISLANSTIVVGEDVAFKVVSSSIDAGMNTTVVTSAPSLEEVFAQVQIRGTFVSTPDMAQPDTTTGVKMSSARDRVQEVVEATSYEWSKVFGSKEEGFEASLSVSGALTVNSDYLFDAGKGGVQRSWIEVASKNTFTVSTSVQKDAKFSSPEVLLGRVRIPVRLTLVDQLLSAVGVRVVSIMVPIRMGIAGNAGFVVGDSESVRAEGALRLNYDPAIGATVQAPVTAITAFQTPVARNPAGAPAYAVFGGKIGPYLRLTPTVAFLDSVAMLGMDARTSVSNSLSLQVVPDKAPFFCLQQSVSTDLTIKGFFKGVVLGTIESPERSINLHSREFDPIGNCLAPVTMSIAPLSPLTGDVGKPIEVQVKVAFDAAKGFAVPDSAPSGYVDIALDSGKCRAVMTSSTGSLEATGRCVLTPLQAGTALPVVVQYSGDAAYATASRVVRANVGKLSSVVTLRQPWPAQPLENDQLQFQLSVQPYTPGVSAEGPVQIVDEAGQVVCEMTVYHLGGASCFAEYAKAGTMLFRAVYQGNSNFTSASSNFVSVVIGERRYGARLTASMRCDEVRNVLLTFEGENAPSSIQHTFVAPNCNTGPVNYRAVYDVPVKLTGNRPYTARMLATGNGEAYSYTTLLIYRPAGDDDLTQAGMVYYNQAAPAVVQFVAR